MSSNNVRVQKVGAHTLESTTATLTTAGLAPSYSICTPERWGLRYSDIDETRPGQLAYPLARDYAKTIHSILLDQIKWGSVYFGSAGQTPTLRLTWPISKDQESQFFRLLRPTMAAALTSQTGGFGIPPEALPTLVSYTPGNALEQGAFSVEYWRMQISFLRLKGLIESKEGAAKTKAGRSLLVRPLSSLADTLYHESRHCQQDFFIYALIQQHPENFENIPNIQKWPMAMGNLRKSSSTSALEIIYLAAKQPLPDDRTALLSLKRMAVGLYTYYLDRWRSQGYWPPYLSGMPEMEVEFQRARTAAIDLLQHVGLGGTPIDVDGMLGEPPSCAAGYTGRPWENDAFFCGDMAAAYWEEVSGNLLKTYPADQCSRDYERDYTMHKRSQSLGNP